LRAGPQIDRRELDSSLLHHDLRGLSIFGDKDRAQHFVAAGKGIQCTL
jgi:hypothetical protein